MGDLSPYLTARLSHATTPRDMLKWFISTYYLLFVVALTNHGVYNEHGGLNPRAVPENAVMFDQGGTSTIIRTARLRSRLPVFELIYGQNSEYELGRALEESMIIKGRPLSAVVYQVEPDLGIFSWMGYDKVRQVLRGTPPVAQPPSLPFNTPSYLDVYIYIGADRSYRLRTVLGITIRERNETTKPTSTPSTSLGPTNQQVPRPGGVVLGMLIAACILMAILVLGGLGWMVAIRGYFNQNRRTVAQHQKSPRALTGHSDTTPLPSASNHASSITSTRRRVRTADHGIPSHQTALQPSSERIKGLTPRKRAATLLQTIHTRAIRGSPKIGFGANRSSPSLDSSSTTARKGFSPRLDLGQFSPRLGLGQLSPRLEIEDRMNIENKLLAAVIDESPELMNSWSSALGLGRFHSSERKRDLIEPSGGQAGSQDSPEASERPTSPTPNKGLCNGGNKTMSVSELLHLRAANNVPVDDSSVSSECYDHLGNLGFIDHTSSALTTSSAQDSPHSPVTLSRAESYAERTTQLTMALLSPPTSMHPNSAVGAFGMSFDSFFSPPTERPPLVPICGEVSSERMVKVGRSQETLTTGYVTASESGVSPSGGQLELDSPSVDSGIPKHAEIISRPSTLHSQKAELDDVSSPSIIVEGIKAMAEAELSSETLSVGNSSDFLSVEYGRADHSVRALNSFPAMLRGSLSCFPEDVSLNTPILPSTGTSRSELTHREASDIVLLPTDDLTQGCLVLTRVGGESDDREGALTSSENTIRSPLMLSPAASKGVVRAEEDSILSHDLSEHATEQSDSIISNEQDSNMRSSVDSIMGGRPAERSSNGLKYAAQLFLSTSN